MGAAGQPGRMEGGEKLSRGRKEALVKTYDNFGEVAANVDVSSLVYKSYACRLSWTEHLEACK